MFYRRFAVILVLLMLTGTTAFAVSEATFLFLCIPPSPQANGMSGVYSAAGNDDPLAPLSDPAVIGLMGERNKLQAAFYPTRTNWLPQYNLSNLTFAARSFFVGFNRQWIKKYLDWNAPVSFGIGYYEVDLDLGNTERTDAQGNSLGSFHSWENSKALGIGIGWHAKKWQAGIGFNHKWAHSELGPFGIDEGVSSADADAFATDFGLLFRVPFAVWWAQTENESATIPMLSPFFTPEFGYSLLNYGGEVSYIDRAQADPLPRTGRMHVGIEAGLNVNPPAFSEPLQFFAINWGRSSEDILVSRDPYGHFRYLDPLADIDPFNDLLLGKANDDVILRTGWEVGMWETFYVRKGRYEDAEGVVFTDSEGYGLRASGLFKFISAIPSVRSHKWFGPAFRHLDIQYHHSVRNSDEPNHPLDNTRDEQISIMIRY